MLFKRNLILPLRKQTQMGDQLSHLQAIETVINVSEIRDLKSQEVQTTNQRGMPMELSFQKRWSMEQWPGSDTEQAETTTKTELDSKEPELPYPGRTPTWPGPRATAGLGGGKEVQKPLPWPVQLKGIHCEDFAIREWNQAIKEEGANSKPTQRSTLRCLNKSQSHSKGVGLTVYSVETGRPLWAKARVPGGNYTFRANLREFLV